MAPTWPETVPISRREEDPGCCASPRSPDHLSAPIGHRPSAAPPRVTDPRYRFRQHAGVPVVGVGDPVPADPQRWLRAQGAAEGHRPSLQVPATPRGSVVGVGDPVPADPQRWLRAHRRRRGSPTLATGSGNARGFCSRGRRPRSSRSAAMAPGLQGTPPRVTDPRYRFRQHAGIPVVGVGDPVPTDPQRCLRGATRRRGSPTLATGSGSTPGFL